MLLSASQHLKSCDGPLPSLSSCIQIFLNTQMNSENARLRRNRCHCSLSKHQEVHCTILRLSAPLTFLWREAFLFWKVMTKVILSSEGMWIKMWKESACCYRFIYRRKIFFFIIYTYSKSRHFWCTFCAFFHISVAFIWKFWWAEFMSHAFIPQLHQCVMYNVSVSCHNVKATQTGWFVKQTLYGSSHWMVYIRKERSSHTQQNMIMISIIMIKTKTSHKTGKPFKDRVLLPRIPLNVETHSCEARTPGSDQLWKWKSNKVVVWVDSAPERVRKMSKCPKQTVLWTI